MKFISVSSNHGQDLDRSLEFIDRSAQAGCSAVKFQLFRVESLFSSEARPQNLFCLNERGTAYRFLQYYDRCKNRGIQFSCTPFI